MERPRFCTYCKHCRRQKCGGRSGFSVSGVLVDLGNNYEMLGTGNQVAEGVAGTDMMLGGIECDIPAASVGAGGPLMIQGTASPNFAERERKLKEQ